MGALTMMGTLKMSFSDSTRTRKKMATWVRSQKEFPSYMFLRLRELYGK